MQKKKRNEQQPRYNLRECQIRCNQIAIVVVFNKALLISLLLRDIFMGLSKLTESWGKINKANI